MTLGDPLYWLSASYTILEIGAILSAIHAVMTPRTPVGAVAWSVALVAMPLLALPLYWTVGRRKLAGYAEARRQGDLALRHLAEEVLDATAPWAAPHEATEGRGEALRRLAALPFLRGNEVRLLVDGAATFDAIAEGIASARSYVLVDYYLFRDDEVGWRLHEEMMRALERGCHVRFVYDEIGYEPAEDFLEELRAAGAEVFAFNDRQGPRKRLQINFRNHRKIVVVDGELAFLGGVNVGEDYLGRHERLTPWRDTHLRLAGPAALAVQLAFLEDWYWASGRLPELDWEPKERSDDVVAFVLPSGPADELETCSLFFVHAINSARRRIWIAAPYFVPDEKIVQALQLAALRGVEVRVLIAGMVDHRIVSLATMSYVEEVTATGAETYRYEGGFMHQKVVLVDDEVAAVGSANFDNRSFRLNFEITALVVDRDFAAEVEAMLRTDFENAQPWTAEDVNSRPLHHRIAMRIARLFAPLL
ncbi:MAG: cardiolipin synthase [Planctomycetota bacterium]